MTAVIRVIDNKFDADGKLCIRNKFGIKKSYTVIPINSMSHIEVYGARFSSAYSTRGGLYIFVTNGEMKFRKFVSNVYIKNDGFAFKNGKSEYRFIEWDQIKNRENKDEIENRFVKTYRNIISKKTVPVKPKKIYSVNGIASIKYAANEILYRSAFI